MIKKVVLRRFKRFHDAEIELIPSGTSLLAGGNNSGKSSLLQAIAVWDFCKTVLQNERGTDAIFAGYRGQGLGLSDDEFSPIATAGLNHLWTDLRLQVPKSDGYSLSILCFWDEQDGKEKSLGISLALTNDRLFIKAHHSNLSFLDPLPPRIAYLPPFAGITSKENKMSGAERRAMIGRGLAGGIIRNLILDMQETNQRERDALKQGRNQIKNSDLRKLRLTDPWEILQSTIGEIFGINLVVEPFNDLYHSSIRVKCFRGRVVGRQFKRHPNFKARDIMAEGSGFLQWLSVYVLALNPEVNVLLLDEPDAHLHPTLQEKLMGALEEISGISGKQILMATHSTEILRSSHFSRIVSFREKSIRYLREENQKIDLFIGLGSNYSPRLDKLRRSKSILLVENDSDSRLLRIFSRRLGVEWPSDLVVWPWTGGSAERRKLFLQLQREIPGLAGVSIRDRDDQSINSVDKETLNDKGYGVPGLGGLFLAVWRRRHIENYLMCPAAIARASMREPEVVFKTFADHGLAIPENWMSKDAPPAILDARGKEIITTSENSIEKVFDLEPSEIAEEMRPGEIPDDIKTIINMITTKFTRSVGDGG